MVVGESKNNETETQRCECINECEMVSYSRAISSSKLSTKAVLSEILENSDVPKRFDAAMEMHYRVQTSSIMQTARVLTAAVKAYRKLRTTIETHVTVAETSITTALSKLLTGLGEMVRGHVADSFKLVKTLDGVYSKHVNYLATGLSAQLQDCDRLTAEVHVIATKSQTAILSTTELERMQLLRDRLEYLGATIVDFDAMLDRAARNSTHQWHYFPDRLLVGDCSQTFEVVNDTLRDLIDWIDSFLPMVSSSYTTTTTGWMSSPPVSMFAPPTVNADVFVNMTKLRSNMASLSDCLMSYKEQLDNFKKWLNRWSKSTFKTGFNYEPPMSHLVAFQAARNIMNWQLDSFLTNFISQKSLARGFNKNVREYVTTGANRLCSHIQQSLFTKVGDLINDQEQGMVSFYNDLLQRVTSIQRYLFANDTKPEQFARRLSVWQMPKLNLQSSQVSLCCSCYCVINQCSINQSINE